jgi:hypothetical protein
MLNAEITKSKRPGGPIIAAILILILSGCNVKPADVQVYSDPVMPLIQLPVDFKSYRQNTNNVLEPGGYYNLLDVKGPGCVRSIWFLYAEYKRIVICADGVTQVDMPADVFFGTLLGKEPYLMNSAALISMPNDMVKKDFGGGGEPGYTCYLPIPFQDSCSIRIYETQKKGMSAMVNWHKYADGTSITPYRLHVAHNIMNPAPARGGTMVMADISGSGFIAGIMQGIIQLKFDDLMYHHGGISWLIDGETDPHAIRGFNMEDDYGFTWGFHAEQTPWFGVPYHTYKRFEGSDPKDGSIFALQQEAIVYRWLGPDPVSFTSSISMRVGTRPDHTETVIWYYKKSGTTAPEVLTPKKWQITGTFPCKTKEEFETADLPASLTGQWPDTLKIGTKKYAVYELEPDHTWVNFHRFYFTQSYTPFALINQAVYSKGLIESNRSRNTFIRIAFDDWLAIWVNGEKVATLHHENDFESQNIPVRLMKGTNEIVVKSINFNKIPNNHLWAFSLIVD